MSEHEDQHMPEVSTEPQRQALDEMSRQLVEKLNAMVHEQHERARRFAAQQHSLSPLPGVAPLPTLPEAPAPLPPPPQPELPSPPAVKKRFPFFPQQPTAQKKPQDFAAPALSGSLLSPRAQRSNEAEKGRKSEESGCGALPTIVFIIILIIILRSCS